MVPAKGAVERVVGQRRCAARIALRARRVRPAPRPAASAFPPARPAASLCAPLCTTMRGASGGVRRPARPAPAAAASCAWAAASCACASPVSRVASTWPAVTRSPTLRRICASRPGRLEAQVRLLLRRQRALERAPPAARARPLPRTTSTVGGRRGLRLDLEAAAAACCFCTLARVPSAPLTRTPTKTAKATAEHGQHDAAPCGAAAAVLAVRAWIGQGLVISPSWIGLVVLSLRTA